MGLKGKGRAHDTSKGARDREEADWGEQHGYRTFNVRDLVVSLRHIAEWNASMIGMDFDVEKQRLKRRNASMGVARIRAMHFPGIPPQERYVHVDPRDVFGGRTNAEFRQAIAKYSEEEFEGYMRDHGYGIMGWTVAHTNTAWHVLKRWARENGRDVDDIIRLYWNPRGAA